MRYAQAELERWLADIDAHARARVTRVEERLSSDAPLREWVLAQDDARERLFAALATGDLEYLRSRPRPWAAWIEDNPPYLQLTTKQTVLVDLDDRLATPPSLTPTRHAFQRKYGCSPEQMASLVRHRPADRPRPIMIKLRANDLANYTGEVGQLVGCILAESREFPDRFYRLQHIRAAAFRLLGVPWETLAAEADKLGQQYRQKFKALQASGSQPGTNVTRDGLWPEPNQLDGRLTYFLVAKHMAAHGNGHRLNDPILDAWIDAGDTIAVDPQDYRTLRDRLGRLYLSHHLVTAPLTGALGGQYGMLAREVNYATTTLLDDTVFAEQRNAAGRAGRVGFATWLFRRQAGLDPPPGRKTRQAFIRYPDDHAFDQFLGRVDHNRIAITADRGDSMEEIEEVVERIAERRGRNPRPLDPAEEARLYTELINFGATDGCRVPSLVLNGVGLTGAVATAATGGAVVAGVAAISLSLGNFCAIAEKAVKVLDSHAATRPAAATLRDAANKICARNMDKVRIDRMADRLWLQ